MIVHLAEASTESIQAELSRYVGTDCACSSGPTACSECVYVDSLLAELDMRAWGQK